jgi:Antitoxin VbhA
MEEAKPATPRVTDAERLRRQKAVEYARGSAWLEGFVLDADIEALNQRYVNGGLTSEELATSIKRAVG